MEHLRCGMPRLVKGHLHLLATMMVESAEYSPNGRRIVTASWDETTKVWDTETGKKFFSVGAKVTASDYLKDWLVIDPFPSSDLSLDFFH